MKMKWSSYLLGILAILFLASSLRATELIVATTADVVNGNTLTPDDLKRDPGPDGISLREAILACNNTPGPHTITFSQTIAGQVITPDTSLPVITQGQVAIAGIQSGDGQPAITIDARGLPIGGFSVLGSNFAVKRLRFIGLNFGGYPGVNVRVGLLPNGQAASPLITNISIEDNIFEGVGESGNRNAISIGTNTGASGVTIRNVSILRNTFLGFKGEADGIHLAAHGTDTVIENVLIQDNTFSETTFPVELVSISSNNRFSNAQILRNRFVGRNVSPITLCAIWNEGSPPASGNIIEDTLISENIFQENNNPAIHLNGGLNAKAMGNTIINTQIVNNLIVGNKDGIFLSGSFEGANGNRIEKTVISNNIFRDNEGPSVSISGGENLGTTGNAILDTQILNNLMTGTRRFVVIGVVGGRNGASGNRIDTVRIINNTIAENPIIDVGAAAIGVVPDIEGSVGNSIGGVTVLNTIFWDNLWGDFSGVTSDEVAFCITSQSGFVGINGNISTDPKFVNPAEGDFHLQPGSPAIDAGTSQGTPVSDLEGNARFDDPATVNTGGGEVPYYDIGCFEYHRPDVASLTIIEEGTGSGMVTSSPAGISCGPTCSGSYIQGTSVTLTAAPSSGSVFAGWSGVCSGTGDCVVTMDSDKSVTATFNLQVAQYSLTVVKVGTGDGTVTSSPAGISCGSACSEIFQKATRVKLTATANSDSIFTGWSGGGCSGTKRCQVTVDSAITITASFDKKVPHISVSPNPLPFGSVKVGKNLKKTLQIANNGTGDLSVSIGGLGGPDFSVAGSTNIMVKPKKSYKLNITFKPTSTGDKTATLVLNSNDPAATTISISLTGKGIKGTKGT